MEFRSGHTHITVFHPSSKRKTCDAKCSSLCTPTRKRMLQLTRAEFVLFAREMRTTHLRPFLVLRDSRERGVLALLDCRMNQFRIPTDTLFCIPIQKSDVK